MEVTKCKNHLYGRKLNDIEVVNGIKNALENLRYMLPTDFQIDVIRKDYETIIKVIYKEEIRK